MKEKNNKGLKWLIIILIILIFGLIGFIIYDKNIIKFEKIKTTQTTKQTNKKIEKLIAEYNLENIREKIYSDEEFFIKFADTVTANEGLKEQKNLIFDLFEIIIDNKKNLDKTYFLSRLADLSINKVAALDMEDADGLYYIDDNYIEYSDDSYNTKTTLHHELLHFLDYSMSSSKVEYFYVCDDYYTLNVEEVNLEEDNCNLYYDSNELFIEGGAEKNSSKYFYDNIPTVSNYSNYFKFYDIMSYIFGNKIIDNIYFSRDTLYELYKLLCINNGLSNQDFNEMIEIFESGNSYYETDKIIDIYYLKNNKKWYKNETFKKMIQSYLVFADSSLANGTKYELEYKKHINNNNVLEIIEEYINKIDSENEKSATEGAKKINGFFTIISNNIYYINYIEYEEFPAEAYVIEYDFDSKKVINHELYPFS